MRSLVGQNYLHCQALTFGDCNVLATAIMTPQMIGHVALANIFCLKQPKMRFSIVTHSEMN